LTEEDKKRIGNIIIEQIRERTRSGVGVSESGREINLQSRPYTKEWIKKKGSSKVDLTFTGDLLENMYVSGTGAKSVTIKVKQEDYGKLRGAEEGILRNRRDSKGKRIPGTGVLVKRPFYRLSANDKREIANSPDFKGIFERAIRRNLKRG
jgi:hypothetical protein